MKQAEADTEVAEIIRKIGVSEQTFYRWKKRYAGMDVAELRRMRVVEDENRKLKQLVADLTFEKHMLQEVLRKKFSARPPTRGRTVHAAGLSGQRALLLSCDGLPSRHHALQQCRVGREGNPRTNGTTRVCRVLMSHRVQRPPPRYE